MILIKRRPNTYEFKTNKALYYGELEHIMEAMILNGIKEEDCISVVQSMIVTDNNKANFGDVYGEFLFLSTF